VKPVVETPQATSDSDVVIAVRNVGKMYRLYDRPPDRLKEQLLWRFGKHYGREFWALRDVSFEVERGESIGIIGRNGSGKSTLLQIIAGILAPTIGEVQVSGRFAALLELGSGFNPEFTGRENIFLNGSVLGISTEEMEARYDDIVAFADIGEFINQPVKLYSSGMVVRLAFAVQAMIQKDVLIVDEALSVGDEAFQRKCMRVLEQFRENGGTVLLVSHNAQLIVRQCNRCVFLHNGQLILDGSSKPVTDIYQRFVFGTSQQQQETLTLLRNNALVPAAGLLGLLSQKVDAPTERPQAATASYGTMLDPTIPKTTELIYGGGQAEIFDYGMFDEAGQQVNVLVTGRTYVWRYHVRFHEKVWNVNFGMMIKSVDGLAIVAINSEGVGIFHQVIERDRVIVVNIQLRMNIAPGTYFLNSGVTGTALTDSGEGGFLHRRVDVCAIRVIAPDGQAIHGLVYTAPHFNIYTAPANDVIYSAGRNE